MELPGWPVKFQSQLYTQDKWKHVTKIYAQIIVTILLIIAKCPSNEEWINKMWKIFYEKLDHKKKQYNGISLDHKSNEVLIHATWWMNLESIMLSELS